MKKLLIASLLVNMALSALLFFSTANAAVTEITDKELVQAFSAKGVTVVEVYATWCGPCKIMGKTIEDLDKHYAGKIKFVKMDGDKNPGVGNSINAYPTILIMKDGKGIGYAQGVRDYKLMVKVLDKVLSSK